MQLAAPRSQIATLDTGPGKHRKYKPMAFTEHGAITPTTILNSPRAVQMSGYVVRAFVKLRQALASTTALARRMEALERSVAALDADTRKQFDQVYEAILGLMGPGRASNSHTARAPGNSHAACTSSVPMTSEIRTFAASSDAVRASGP